MKLFFVKLIYLIFSVFCLDLLKFFGLLCSLTYGGTTLAFFPAITICRRGSSFQFAFMAFMTSPGTFSTTTKAIGQSTCATFKNILIDMIGSGPSKTASIIATDHSKRGIIWRTSIREDHGHQGLLLGVQIVGTFLGYFLSSLKKNQCGRIRPVKSFLKKLIKSCENNNCKEIS